MKNKYIEDNENIVYFVNYCPMCNTFTFYCPTCGLNTCSGGVFCPDCYLISEYEDKIREKYMWIFRVVEFVLYYHDKIFHQERIKMWIK